MTKEIKKQQDITLFEQEVRKKWHKKSGISQYQMLFRF